MSSETGKISSATWREVPKGVWALGFVSLLMDVSSELIHSLLPVFLVTVVGTGMAVIGVIEGVAEATTAMAKIFSGALSDRIGKRKLLVGIGYGLAAVTKPVFPLASTAWEVLAARLVDRVGKGIRDAPRDALVADITPPAIRGASYGIRQALDTVGGFAGPLLAMALLAPLNLVSGAALLLASVLAGWLWQSFGAMSTFLAGAAFSGLAVVIMFVAMNQERSEQADVPPSCKGRSEPKRHRE